MSIEQLCKDHPVVRFDERAAPLMLTVIQEGLKYGLERFTKEEQITILKYLNIIHGDMEWLVDISGGAVLG